ncbi:MAG: hypothetical protein KJ732_08230, partial [Candidatus Margulisbacteria bacterium]|nr:hypothetical protein [Candidatus Margulisiibacteriota bacterium]
QKVAQEGVLYNAYTAAGKFRQPELPWLNENWLRIILQITDRQEKILLTKAMAQARLATVRVEGRSMCTTYENVLLPRGVSPLEIAFIADPLLGVHLVEAFHQDVPKDIKEPIREGIGYIKLQIGDEFLPRDYAKLLSNPLARLRFVDYLGQMGEQAREALVRNILENELAKTFLGLGDLAETMPPGTINEWLARMIKGEVSAEQLASEIGLTISGNVSGLLSLERLELGAPEKLPGEVIAILREVFPIERYGFEGPRLKVSIPVRSEAQAIQFRRFLDTLNYRKGVEVISHGSIKPPIFDDLTLNPHSLYYSYDLALRAALALQSQGGSVVNINLNPPGHWDAFCETEKRS